MREFQNFISVVRALVLPVAFFGAMDLHWGDLGKAIAEGDDESPTFEQYCEQAKGILRSKYRRAGRNVKPYRVTHSCQCRAGDESSVIYPQEKDCNGNKMPGTENCRAINAIPSYDSKTGKISCTCRDGSPVALNKKCNGSKPSDFLFYCTTVSHNLGLDNSQRKDACKTNGEDILKAKGCELRQVRCSVDTASQGYANCRTASFNCSLGDDNAKGECPKGFSSQAYEPTWGVHLGYDDGLHPEDKRIICVAEEKAKPAGAGAPASVRPAHH